MSFFRIPVAKVAAEILDVYNPGSTVQFNASQKAMVDGLEENRFWVHIAARRTGKSFAASIIALAKLLEPNQQVTVVAPNYNLSSIIWDYVTGFIKQLNIETDRFNQKDKIVVLINGSVFRLLSANNRDSLVGRAANLLIVDEAAVIDDDEYFTRDLRPSLSTFEDSRALFITTPRGKANYIYEYYMRGDNEEYDDWGSALFDWTCNPLLNEDDIEAAKVSSPHDVFMQEYYCEWAIFEGQIYNLNEDKHLLDLHYITPEDKYIDFIGGLDIGYRDATAFIVIGTKEDNFYVVDGYISGGMTTAAHAARIKELEAKWGISTIYIDSAAAQTRADLAYEYDIFCNKSTKSIKDGIAYVQTLVENDRLLFDKNNADHIFYALAAYRWNTKSETQKPVHDDSSHPSDALRYAVYSHLKSSGSIMS